MSGNRDTGSIWWFLPVAVIVATIAGLTTDQMNKTGGWLLIIGALLWLIVGKNPGLLDRLTRRK